jgi:hypothetical protein
VRVYSAGLEVGGLSSRMRKPDPFSAGRRELSEQPPGGGP